MKVYQDEHATVVRSAEWDEVSHLARMQFYYCFDYLEPRPGRKYDYFAIAHQDDINTPLAYVAFEEPVYDVGGGRPTFLQGVAVNPSHAGKGLSSLLYSAVLQHDDYATRDIYTYVAASNTSSLRLHIKHRFLPCEPYKMFCMFPEYCTEGYLGDDTKYVALLREPTKTPKPYLRCGWVECKK